MGTVIIARAELKQIGQLVAGEEVQAASGASAWICLELVLVVGVLTGVDTPVTRSRPSASLLVRKGLLGHRILAVIGRRQKALRRVGVGGLGLDFGAMGQVESVVHVNVSILLRIINILTIITCLQLRKLLLRFT